MRHTTALSFLALTTLSLTAACMDVDTPRVPDRDSKVCDGDSAKRVDSAVTIRSEADLDDLPSGCWDLYSSLTIQGSEITSLAGLGRLIGVNELRIVDTKLVEIDAEMPLKVYGPITITGNSLLRDLANVTVERADDLTAALTIDDNAALVSLGGIVDLPRVDGDLTITNNPKLEAVALKVQQIDGTTRISNNAALTSIELAKLAVVRRIEITNNAALTSLGGFTAVAIQGDLVLRGNRALATLGTMASLDRIEGSLTIDDNDALVSIGLFSTAAQYLTGTLTVSNNANLADLGRLAYFRGIGSINVSSNPKLSTCKVTEIDRCVPQHGSITNVANLSQTNCPATWCGQ